MKTKSRTPEFLRSQSDECAELKMRHNVTTLTGSLGINQIRYDIGRCIVYKLKLLVHIQNALISALRPRSIIYGDEVFICLCHALCEQKYKKTNINSEEKAALGKTIALELKRDNEHLEKIALSLFPGFGYVFSQKEMPSLYRNCCVE